MPENGASLLDGQLFPILPVLMVDVVLVAWMLKLHVHATQS